MVSRESTLDRFQEEERAYWRQREELLLRYPGKWVAVVAGEVVAVGDNPGAVIREALRVSGSTVGYVAQVGEEDVLYRVRRVAQGYHDRAYARAMPKVTAQLQHLTGGSALDVDFVVDTGADLTVVRDTVAEALGLYDSPWRAARIAGIGGPGVRRPLYAGTVRLADHDIFVEVDCRSDIDEDILGRDVINEFALTLCPKRGQVEFEWIDEA